MSLFHYKVYIYSALPQDQMTVEEGSGESMANQIIFLRSLTENKYSKLYSGLLTLRDRTIIS